MLADPIVKATTEMKRRNHPSWSLATPRTRNKRVKDSVYHIEGIVNAGDNNFLFDTRLVLRRALDAGETPTDLFLAALEMKVV